MIRVNINTLVADREAPPANVIGLGVGTLRNLQSLLDPVPDNVLGFEWWDMVDNTADFDSRTHVKGLENLTADAGTRKVSSVFTLDERPLDDVTAHCEKEVRAKMRQVLAQDIDVDGIMSSRAELQENSDLLDGSGPSEINLDSGRRTLTVPMQNTLKNKLKSDRKDSHKRAVAILDLIAAETTGTGKVAVLDVELVLGWPT